MTLKVQRNIILHVQYRGKIFKMQCIRNELTSMIKKTLKIDKFYLEKYREEIDDYVQVPILRVENNDRVRVVLGDSSSSPKEVQMVWTLIEKIEKDICFNEDDCGLLQDVLSDYMNPGEQTDETAHRPKRRNNKETEAISISCQTKSTCYNVDEYVEFMKQNPDKKEKTQSMMHLTYSDRRSFIHDKSKVKLVLKAYPGLFNFDEVERELGRICGAGEKSMKELFYRNLKKYTKNIMAAVPTSNAFVKKIKSILKKGQSNFRGKDKWACHVGTLLCLPYIFEETSDEIIFFQNQGYKNVDTPVIYCDSSAEKALSAKANFQIFVEEVLLCSTEDMRDAIFAFFAAYHVFSIIFPRSYYQTLMVLHILFFEQEPDILDRDGYTEAVKQFIRDMKSI